MKRITAIACALTAAFTMYPFRRSIPSEHLSAYTRISLEAFRQQVQNANAQRAYSEHLFQELAIDCESENLFADGEKQGREYAGWHIQNHQLYYHDMTLAEAADAMGCETVYTSNQQLVLRSPFQSGRLILQSSGHVADTNAEEVACGWQGLQVLQYDSPQDAYSAYQTYSAQSGIQLVCPERIYSLPQYEASTEQDLPWGVQAIGSQEYISWLRSTTDVLPEITVAVIDTGVDETHSLLQDRIASNGINFSYGGDGSYRDGHGHGTHVAGIIAQNTPENVRILPIKALSDQGRCGSVELYCGILYAVRQHADVINMSIGGDGTDPLIALACKEAEAADIAVCAAAGNESNNIRYHHPPAFSNTVSVSAVQQITAEEGISYQLAYFSNYGNGLDFAAPGYLISSSVPGDSFQSWSGTSMACPFASAAFADLLSYQPEFTVSQMYHLLKQNALDLGESGYDNSYGWGLIQLKPVSDTDIPKAEDASDDWKLQTETKTEVLAPWIPEGEHYKTISLNEPFHPRNDTIYQMTLLRPMAIRAAVLSGEIKSFQMCDDKGWTYDAATEMTFDPGIYTIQFTAEPDTVILLQSAVESIANTFIEVLPAFETGKELRPHAIVYDAEGTLLKEGKDYCIQSEVPLISSGKYAVTICGIGEHYTEEIQAIFQILPQIEDGLPILTEGTHTVHLPEFQSAVVYQWTPEKSEYCIYKDDLSDTCITVFDQQGNVISFLCELALAYQQIAVSAGEKYYVSVAYRSMQQKGITGFSLTSAYRMMEDCDIQIPQYVPLNSEPDLQVTYGDALLQEGTDYRIMCEDNDHLGRSEIYLVGIGSYIGITSAAYISVPDAAGEYTDADAVITQELQLNTPVNETVFYPGTLHVFHFQAAENGIYYLHLPDETDYETAVWIYGDNGERITLTEGQIALQQGESITICCVANYILNTCLMPDRVFSIMVSDSTLPVTVPEGDFTGDAAADVLDLTALMYYLSETYTMEPKDSQYAGCDLNRDGILAMEDLMLIMQNHSG
ncbi:MAG: S8 family serine peptidase [Oscillospiraceae bacterium]|nr:S8 family serine peptidase [Oscillospiraceae bacterium]